MRRRSRRTRSPIQRHPVVPDEVAAFGKAVVASLRDVLGDDLVGSWFVGSIALGGYVAGESDIDVLAVSQHALPDPVKRSVADAVIATTASCPARGLELTLYRHEVATSAPVDADFEVNVNGGPRMERAVQLDARDEPGFWYVLDRAIAHRSGVTITGPPAAEVFPDVPRAALLLAMTASMRWHREHEKATLYSVLNASRSWRYAVDDVLGSKLEGAAWARERWPDASVIDAAVELRHGRPAVLDGQEVDALLAHVEATLLASR
jgi:Domain of unknown function (DUF4111)